MQAWLPQTKRLIFQIFDPQDFVFSLSGLLSRLPVTMLTTHAALVIITTVNKKANTHAR